MKKNYTGALALFALLAIFAPQLSANVLFPGKISGDFDARTLAFANPAYLGEKVYVFSDPGLLESIPEVIFSGDPTSICVNVFNDYNSNGMDDGLADPAISSVTVTAYDQFNMPTVLMVQSDGNYAFTPGNTNTYRIEVTNLPAGLEPSTAGATTVAFASQGETVNVGLHYPDEFYSDDIFLVVPCYVEGSAAPSGPNANGDVLVILPENSLTPGAGTVNPTEYYVADQDEIGATFGLSYNRASNSVFAAAFAKRHTGFGPSGTGAIYRVDLNGDEPTPPISGVGVSTIVDLNALFGATTAGTNPHPNLPTTNFDRDPLAYDAVGKVGLGGLAYVSTTNTLWTINLADRQLYEIPLGGTAANPTSPSMAAISTWPASGDLTDLPDLPGTAGSRDTDIRPFAVKQYRGKIYIGLVSTAESTVVFNAANSTVSNTGDRTEMEGFIYEFDPATDVFTQLLSFPLNYPREQAIDFCSNNALAEFNPWSPVYDATTFSSVTMATEGGTIPERAYPQPWITDIEFTEDGRMVIGIRDRFADQHGYNQLPPNPLAANDPNTMFTADGAGDVLLASLNTMDNTTFVLESNSTNGVNGRPFGPTLGQGQGEGPGGGEFFFDDRYRPANAPPDNQFEPGCALDVNDMDPPLQGNVREQGHDETSLGGIFNYNGQLNLITSVYDPLDDWNLPFNNAGMISLNTTNGNRTGGNQVYATPTDPGTFAKGNGLGDVEGVAGSAPLQMGNRLWVDTDGDGLQDADEAGLNGVLVELYKDDGMGTFFKVAETTTAADAAQGNGIYIFSDDSDTDQNWTFSGETEVLPNMNYEIRVDLADAQAQDATIFTFSPMDAGGDTDNDNVTDINDSDASATGVIAFTTGNAGENNHGLDVGFRPASCDLLITTIDPSCTFDPMTGQSTFAVQVSLSWDFESLPATSDAIEVTFAGQTETTAQLNTATGMTTVNFTGVTGPVYNLVAEANFVNKNDCEATGVVDLIACTPECTDGLGGNVFNDFDNNGEDAGDGEPSQENVLVEVYECDGMTPAYTTYTNVDGNWTVPSSVMLEYPVRVEFSTPLQPYLQSSFAGTDNGTNTQFVDAASCEVDYGVLDPSTYCEENPFMAVPCYVSGDPLVAGTAGSMPGIISFPYTASGANTPAATSLATAAQVGSTWGIAYDRARNDLYAASFLRRHIGLGPLGLGGIYQIGIDAGAATSVTSFIDVSTLGVPVGTVGSNMARGLSGTASQPNADPTTVDMIGKVGLGDIDVSTDGNTLWFTSLFNQTLYALDISSGDTPTTSDLTSYPIPNPGCSGGNWRPFAIKVVGNELYVGGVCDAETSQNVADLTATIYRFSSGTFATVLSFDLNYTRGSIGDRCLAEMFDSWNPWTDVILDNCDEFADGYPQPILSDIEFDDDGSMIIGFFDRFGHQTGYRQLFPDGTMGTQGSFGEQGVAGGDILRAESDDSGSFILENNGSSGGITTAGANNGEGPGGGEYYFGEALFGHNEKSLGGLALLSGSGEVVLSMYNPVGTANTNGVAWISNTTGDFLRGYQAGSGAFVEEQGKAGGFGDLELLCAPPPIQIGNYAWIDLDEDGVQDACEEPLANVPVFLYTKADNGGLTQVAMTTTDTDGNYYFTNGSDPDETWVDPMGEVLPDTSYLIVFGDAATAPTDTTILVDGTQYAITTDSTGEGNNPFFGDSNAEIIEVNGTMLPGICYNTADSTDHTLDVGFIPQLECDLRIVSVDPSCTYDPADGQSTFSVEVEVGWDNEFLADANDQITVSFAGQTMTVDPMSAPVGMATVTFNGVAGPSTCEPIVASFSNNDDCSATAVVDLIACTPPCTDALGGSVFQDINNNGTEDAGESGQESVLVEVYECDNPVPVATTWTNANGDWSVGDTNISYPVRVEFSTPMQDFLDPTLSGMNNGTEVQFVDMSSCEVDYGVYDPAYCQGNSDGANTVNPAEDDIKVMLTCFVNGATDGTGPGDVLVAYDYDETGEAAPDVLANKGEIGSVWSLAYDSQRDVVYTGAFTKRHVGMGDEGPGAIYQYDFASDQVTTLIDLADFGLDISGFPTETSRSLGNADGTNRDPEIFDLVGKTGIGDIDISEDGQTLYAVSLADKTLYEIDIAGQTVTNTYPTLDPGCDNGNWRPFALNVHEGKVYVGGVCDAQNGTSDDLIASVAVLTDNGFAEVLSYPLNYRKGRVQANVPSASGLGNWLPWEDDFNELTFAYNTQNTVGRPVVIHPQPVLSDIEFDVDGSIIMAFFDRTGHQMGINNLSPTGTVDSTWTAISGGDILRASRNIQGAFVLENNGEVGGLSGGVGNQQGPGAFPNNGEFYQGDNFISGGAQVHQETSLGGIALLPGSGEVVLSVYDPINGGSAQFGSGGTIKLSNVNGGKNDPKRVYAIGDPGTFGKANGLGDVEITCPPPALQIGNYAWIDLDEDGVQDACEDPLPNLPVFLYTKAAGGGLTQVAMTMTDTDGNYYFTNGSDPDETWVDPMGEVLPDTSYLIVFGDAATAPTDTTILVGGEQYTITTDSTGEGNSPFFGDSNAELIDVNGTMLPAICYNTADTTDHTLDVGFIPVATLPASLGNYVWLDENSDGLQDAGEPGIPNVLVVLKNMAGTPIDSTLTDADGGYLFPDLDAAMYFVDVIETTLPDIDGDPMTQDLSQTTIFTNVVDGADPDTDPDDGDLGNKDHADDGYKITLVAGEENLTGDFGYNYVPTDDVNNPMGSPLGALGDRVWFDADQDGQQDPEEVGVEGVTLKLIAASAVTVDGTLYVAGEQIATDVTDANGYYLFDGLPAGAYNVMVADDADGTGTGGPLEDYEQTGDPDHFATSEADNPDDAVEDDNMTTVPVILGPGDVFLNVDFGYDNDDELGAIGDFVWFDADADGNGPNQAGADGVIVNQGNAAENDAAEQPIAGVTVALIDDANGDGKWNTGEPIIGTDVTDEDGLYFFPGLPAGAGEDYLVVVTDNDNVLSGLRPTYDADGGTMEMGESYPVDQMSNMELGFSSVQDLPAGAGNEVVDQDFGYTPEDHDPGDGYIGDYVWFDTDGNDTGGQTEAEAEEDTGIEGVVMELLDDNGAIIATTVTDDNGFYFFGNLPVDADGEDYQVVVAAENFQPGGALEDLETTFEPDGDTDNEGDLVSLTTASPGNLDQDFGYTGDDANTLGSVGNRVWLDRDADGIYEPNGQDGTMGTADDETPFEGVTLDIYRDLDGNGELDPNEPRIGTDVTDANGLYLFGQLPLDDYIVNLTDEDEVLLGYWHSTGAQDAGTNVMGDTAEDSMDNSKEDAFAVTIDATVPNNLNVDFGYYKDPAALGNYVWIDADRNGLQNDGETGINGVGVMMVITYADGTEIMLTDTTRNDQDGNPGFYDFRNLLLDEDYRDTLASNEPEFIISVDGNQTAFTDLGLVPTIADIAGNASDDEDSDNFNGVSARAIQGSLATEARDPETTEEPIATYDFGAAMDPILCDTNDGCSYLADFETDDMGNPMVAGMYNVFVEQPYADLFGPGEGLTFSTNDQANHPLNLYNTDGTGGLDADLERNSAGTNQWDNGNIITEMLGNVLIINQTTDITQPNDFGGGGELIINSDRPLGRFAFDLIDLEPVNVGTVTFANTQTGNLVTIPFDDFEAGSGSPYEVAGVVFGDRTANRVISITADTLGLVSFDSIAFNLPSQSGAIGVICATVNQKFDLALVKRLDDVATPGPFEPGDTVTFALSVYNQGEEDAVDIVVQDYVPEGLTLTPTAQNEWMMNADTAVLIDSIDLAAGDSTIVSITFLIDTDFMLDTLTNRAEIAYFDDDGDPNTDPPQDNDSTPGDNGDDDPEVDTPNEYDDENPDYPGDMDDPDDEDDYDFQGIPIMQSFDLNLVKYLDTMTTPGPFTYGSTVTFAIEVRNQGTLDATDVEVADYVPAGLTLVADVNWMMDADTARTTMPFDLAAGDTTTLSISFTIDLDFEGTSITNLAEITAAENALGLPDDDSTPGDNGNTPLDMEIDDEDSDDGLNGDGTPDNPDDADDFDLAMLSIETASLGSTVFLDNNNDGLQNGADAGIPMVEVQLFDAMTMMPVLTDAAGARVLDAVDVAPTLTDASGNYHFTNLLPGDYYVVIPTAPANAPISSNNAGIAFVETDPDDNADNDDEGTQSGSGAAVTSGTITLALGDEPENGTGLMDESAQGNLQDDAFDSNGNMTLDFGFFAPVSVGDTAFVDLDDSGTQTLGDGVLEGVTVVLLDAATGDTITVDAEDNPISGITMTAADGSYSFPNIPPGDYRVSFDISTANDAEFYAFVTPNVGGDDALDSDATPLNDSVGLSAPTGFLPSGTNDPTLDVGVLCTTSVTLAPPATICSTQKIVLNEGASITPMGLGGTWSTPDGTGTFDNGTDFATATTYTTSPEDAARGSVTLVLTTNDPNGPCGIVTEQVIFQILRVDCGSFFWNGSN